MPEEKTRRWYATIRLKERYERRKVWYLNDGYICDCINKPFKNKEECHASMYLIERKFGDQVENVTIHWTR